jgi:predicted glycoside hydrolase/deacetylase ChbG (UPF0249 family)
MLRTVVINADDLGLDDAANAGIARAVEAGHVGAASLLVTTPRAREGLARARGWAGQVGIGLHLDLVEGRALSGPIRGLTRADGRFLGLRRALASAALGRIDVDAVAREVAAQRAAIEGAGIALDHLNGHRHAHVLPGVRDAVLRHAGDVHVRAPIEAAPSRRPSPRRALLHRLARGWRGPPPRTTSFVGLDGSPERVLRALGRVPGNVEWMVHPRAGEPRHAQELALLVDPGLRDRLAEAGLRPGRYGDLPTSPPRPA